MSDMCNSTDAIASKNTKYQRNIVCYLTKKGIFTSQFIHNTKWKPHVVRNHEGLHYKAYDSIFKESLDYLDHLFLDLCTKLVLVMIKIRVLVQELFYKTVLGLRLFFEQFRLCQTFPLFPFSVWNKVQEWFYLLQHLSSSIGIKN